MAGAHSQWLSDSPVHRAIGREFASPPPSFSSCFLPSSQSYRSDKASAPSDLHYNQSAAGTTSRLDMLSSLRLATLLATLDGADEGDDSHDPEPSSST